jgi:hypothetical protein
VAYTPAWESLDRDAQQPRTAQIERFTRRQRNSREWINFAEIAEWCSEEDQSIAQNENKRTEAFNRLASDLLTGEFEENGRSLVLFLHPATKKMRMAHEELKDAIKHNWDGHDGRSYLAHCWIPRRLFERWRIKHRLPASPRFQPQQSYRISGAKARDEAAALIPKRGAKTRGVREALNQLWPEGIPEGLTAKERNQQVLDQLKRNRSSMPKDIARAIQRALQLQRSR